MTGNFRVIFISPLYNAAGNVLSLCSSINAQKDGAWCHRIVDDQSTDDLSSVKEWIALGPSARSLTQNTERKYALRNIIEIAREYQDEPNTIIATVDGDDQLCNEFTVGILRKAYDTGADIVWTAHRWDTNGMNISREMPPSVDPYAWPWCSSHLRTFRASLLSRVSDENFKDHQGKWFKRGYDQALMLPLLSLTERRQYVPDVCYLYNIDSKSIPAADRNYSEKSQLSTVNFVRARGFVK